jgi:hypothetical protein
MGAAEGGFLEPGNVPGHVAGEAAQESDAMPPLLG